MFDDNSEMAIHPVTVIVRELSTPPTGGVHSPKTF